MVDSGAALLDERMRPPRQGDGDEGRALLLDAPAANRWPSLLALGEALFGRLDWWPPAPPDAASSIIAALSPRNARGGPAGAPAVAVRGCRNYPAAHDRAGTTRRSGAAATAVRMATSASLLTPMPTRCRSRSDTAASMFWPIRVRTATTASQRGGPTSARRSRTTPSSSTGGASPPKAVRSSGCATPTAGRSRSVDAGDFAEWTAEHDGYPSLNPPARHRRSVRLDRASRSIDIVDEIDAAATTCAWPSTSGRTSRPSSTVHRACFAGPDAPAPGAARLELPRSFAGPCTEARLTRSSAGTPAASDAGSRGHPARPRTFSLRSALQRETGVH